MNVVGGNNKQQQTTTADDSFRHMNPSCRGETRHAQASITKDGHSVHPERIRRERRTGYAIADRHSGQLVLKRAEQLVPDQEGAPEIAVTVLVVLTMMNTVMRRR